VLLHLIGRVLDAAHASGLVHRDLRPTNLFLDKSGTAAKISDFGVSILRASAPPAPGWAGPVGWTAPDAADVATPATPQMDTYSIGTVVFFLLTGKSPFLALQG